MVRVKYPMGTRGYVLTKIAEGPELEVNTKGERASSNKGSSNEIDNDDRLVLRREDHGRSSSEIGGSGS